MPTRREESNDERPLPESVTAKVSPFHSNGNEDTEHANDELQPEDLLELRRQAVAMSADGLKPKNMDEKNGLTEQHGSENESGSPLVGAFRRGGVNSNDERGEENDHSSQTSWEPLTHPQSESVLLEASLVVEQEQARTPTNDPLEHAPNQDRSESKPELVEATPIEDPSKRSQVHLVRRPLVWLLLVGVLLVVVAALGGVLATMSPPDDSSPETSPSSKELDIEDDIVVTYHISVYGVGISDGSCESYSPGSIHVECGSKSSPPSRITIVHATGNIQCPSTSSEGKIECETGNGDSGALISGYILFSCTASMSETESESESEDPVRARSRVSMSTGQNCTANDKTNVSVDTTSHTADMVSFVTLIRLCTSAGSNGDLLQLREAGGSNCVDGQDHRTGELKHFYGPEGDTGYNTTFCFLKNQCPYESNDDYASCPEIKVVTIFVMDDTVFDENENCLDSFSSEDPDFESAIESKGHLLLDALGPLAFEDSVSSGSLVVEMLNAELPPWRSQWYYPPPSRQPKNNGRTLRLSLG